ncbi:MAG: transposase [Chloroflexota bacterium]|nr:transposase [Chloroflexota bacterium]
MDRQNAITPFPHRQGQLAELEHAFNLIYDRTILQQLQEYRWTGRPGYPLSALWRAYVASFVLNLPHTNALIRLLEDNVQLRNFCGFGDQLPHRTTFNRFISRLSHHSDLVESCLTRLTCRLKQIIPNLGHEVAIDSTAVRSHSNGNRKHGASDPEATWGVKHSARSRDKEQTEYFYGYKVHMVADANHDIPLAQIVTTGSRNDSPVLPDLMKHAQKYMPWLKPKVAIADRGYDALSNHKFLDDAGIYAIIHLRKQSKDGPLHFGIYDTQGRPHCMGNQPMQYVKTNKKEGHLYRCHPQGCKLKNSKAGAITHCDGWSWEQPESNLRIISRIPRSTRTWKRLYTKRQSIERVFKGQKESRRLEAHCVRGMRKITLHCLMSTLAFQVTALNNRLQGIKEEANWMVRRIA